jgi:predicted extracellular nuclease
MKKSWIIGSAVVGCLAGVSVGACGSSNGGTGTTSGTGGVPTTSATSATSGSGSTSGSTTGSSTTTSSSGGPSDGGGGADAGAATTTIAAARMGNVTASITVAAVVTAVQGPSGDEVNYYIEDPAGGPYSGIVVYCDPLETSCPAGPRAGNPSVGDYVLITGAISAYKGQAQIAPKAYALIEPGHALPAPVTVLGSDIAAGSTSAQYRGVLVKLAETVTVTNLTPSALYDTQCDADAGVMGQCTGCTPPTYSGFQVTDSTGDVIYVEQYLFPGDPLQSSPECVSMPGQVAVTQGETFPFMEGILDYDGYASAQFMAPRSPSDY